MRLGMTGVGSGVGSETLLRLPERAAWTA